VTKLCILSDLHLEAVAFPEAFRPEGHEISSGTADTEPVKQPIGMRQALRGVPLAAHPDRPSDHRGRRSRPTRKEADRPAQAQDRLGPWPYRAPTAWLVPHWRATGDGLSGLVSVFLKEENDNRLRPSVSALPASGLCVALRFPTVRHQPNASLLQAAFLVFLTAATRARVVAADLLFAFG
jgi:hypothetical protein